MGVLELFGTLIKNKITSSAIISNIRSTTDINYIFYDFNSIIHEANEEVVKELNLLLQSLLENLFMKIPFDSLKPMFDKHKLIMDNIDLDMKAEDLINVFHSQLTGSKMDKLVIKQTIKNWLSILKSFVDKSSLKIIYVGIDGVPSKGKIIEQIQRKYSGAFTQIINSKILEKHKDYLLKEDNYAYLREKNAVTWLRSKITPGTIFLEKMVKYLKSPNIKKIINDYFINLKEFIVSDMHEYGEAEMKIANYVKNKISPDDKSKICFYSPDADGILLSMLFKNPNVFLLKSNKQAKCFDLVNIQMLKKNIAQYVKGHNVERIINDFVVLSTIFGNDFVPKIPSINVKQGFQIIIEIYIKTLEELKDMYLVKVDTDNNHRLNLTFMRRIFEKLITIEDDFIEHNEMYNKYLMYHKFRSIFPTLEVNEKSIREIFNMIKTDYNKLQETIRTGDSLTYYVKDDELISRLKIALDIKIDDNIISTLNMTNLEFINTLIDYHTRYGNFPKLNLNLNTFSKSINDFYHKSKTDQLKMNLYQKEKYQFENKLDMYYVKSNAQKLDLSKNKIKDFYDEYFPDQNINNICKDYLEGSMWVFNYYFNKNKYISYYFYPHEKSPLIRDIFAYLMKISHDDFRDMFQNLVSYDVDNLEEFFNPIEQLFYTLPRNVPEFIKILPKEYRSLDDKLNKKLDKYFIDINSVCDEYWKEKGSSNVIDCKGMMFKCLIKPLHMLSKEDDMKILKILRTININISKILAETRMLNY